jgi:L-rhamnose isomerase/sugar isomerase
MCIEEKFADASEVHGLTCVTPRMALHVFWDLPSGLGDIPTIQELERKTGIRAGSINQSFRRQTTSRARSLIPRLR